ncbi:acetylornithine deacetylase [Thiolapillus brandeum]|uniref:Acetylornithine deacetylase n=1 Tax=Thiolapillus brandeum TaxID=1076588 RepID=A0A7U6GK40_9GAMM|nr:acetylornithine deacetylase [Thiolapillus brandeum]BAO45103.1 acetylornithine deacetylase [Thiolapillus brandeum]
MPGKEPPPLLHMMQRLIAEPSVSSVSPAWDQPNVRVIDLLAEWLQGMGFEVRKLAVPDHPGKFNLIASLGSGPDGLVLSGHTDTVPFDESRWRSDPFTLTKKDNRLYGLGSTDMKGFFALVLEALRGLDLSPLKHPLVILATADEESSMSGARALAESGQSLGRHAVIGEPTGLRPIRMHKGIAMECIRITGRSGHSSNPALGNNALEGMNLVLTEIMQWRQELGERYTNPLFEVAVPTVNLGHIHGGDNPNRICGQCELHIDIRPLPGMNLENLRGELDMRLARVLQSTGLELERQSMFGGVPALETPASAEIVHTAEQLSGYAAEAVAFGTEGPFLQQMGMDTVILGPGSIDQAHQPDEFMSMDQIRPGIAIIQQLIQRFCLT